jgi:hypothetical protein
MLRFNRLQSKREIPAKQGGLRRDGLAPRRSGAPEGFHGFALEVGALNADVAELIVGKAQQMVHFAALSEALHKVSRKAHRKVIADYMGHGILLLVCGGYFRCKINV